MNAHTALIPTNRAADAHRKFARNLTIATRIEIAARNYAHTMAVSGGRENTNTDLALIELLDAVQWVADDIGETLGELLRENGLDEEGYHVNDDGDRDYRRDREVVIGERFL